MLGFGRNIHSILDSLEQDYILHQRKSYKTLLSHLKPIRTALGKHKADGIRAGTITFYMTVRQKQGTAPATINREIAALKRAYSLADLSFPHVQLLRENNVRQGVFTKEEIERVCEVLPKHLQPIVKFAYLTGRRKGEILAIQWSDIDLPNKVILVRQSTTKNGLPDTIPLTDDLVSLLYSRDMGSTVGCPYVFCHGRKPIGDFTKTWDRACAKVGLTGRYFHDIRRTVSTDLRRAGVPEIVAMTITGHKSRKTFERYNIISEDDTRSAQQKLSDYRKDKE